jgi:hypothetical protein
MTDLFYNAHFNKLPINLKAFDSLFFIGSCFSNNISEKLQVRKFDIQSNPYGILFDTLSIHKAINEIIDHKMYDESDLFYHNELYGSWNHHTEFSDTSTKISLKNIRSTDTRIRSGQNSFGSSFGFESHVQSGLLEVLLNRAESSIEASMAILDHVPDHPSSSDFSPSEAAAASLADEHTMEALAQLLTMLEHKWVLCSVWNGGEGIEYVLSAPI